jgi:uncharacterized protein YqeY
MLLDRIQEDLRTATKERDETRKAVLRWTLAECKNLRIEKGTDLEDEDVVVVIKRGVKMRKEALAEYEKAGRSELVASESREMELLGVYLPEQLSGDALRRVVEEAISATGAASMRDFGTVMQSVMRDHGNEVDGKEVQALVKACLSG